MEDKKAPSRELKQLRDWKSAAMKQLAKSEALMKILPMSYLGWDVYEAAIDYIKKLEARASSGAMTPTEQDEYSQKSVDIIKNLAMLVRRLCHRLNKHEPKSTIVDMALEYLRGEGLQGSILREGATTPPSEGAKK